MRKIKEAVDLSTGQSIPMAMVASTDLDANRKPASSMFFAFIEKEKIEVDYESNTFSERSLP